MTDRITEQDLCDLIHAAINVTDADGRKLDRGVMQIRAGASPHVRLQIVAILAAWRRRKPGLTTPPVVLDRTITGVVVDACHPLELTTRYE